MTKEELGGASVHLRSGIVDNLATDEHDALHQIRRYLSYLPSSIYPSARYTVEDPVDRQEQAQQRYHATVIPALICARYYA